MKQRNTKLSPWNEVASFEMRVSYDTLPERCELESLIELARTTGMVTRATYVVSKPSTEELV